jgi:hypothetical protein
MNHDFAPTTKATDDEIRAWAVTWANVHKLRGIRQQCVELTFAITPDEPDIAVIHWDKPGCPVTREKSLALLPNVRANLDPTA